MGAHEKEGGKMRKINRRGIAATEKRERERERERETALGRSSFWLIYDLLWYHTAVANGFSCNHRPLIPSQFSVSAGPTIYCAPRRQRSRSSVRAGRPVQRSPAPGSGRGHSTSVDSSHHQRKCPSNWYVATLHIGRLAPLPSEIGFSRQKIQPI